MLAFAGTFPLLQSVCTPRPAHSPPPLSRNTPQASDCVFLCDDDNDMELAAVVGKAFLPSITSVSQRTGRPARIVERVHSGGSSHPLHFHACPGLLMTCEALPSAVAHCVTSHALQEGRSMSFYAMACQASALRPPCPQDSVHRAIEARPEHFVCATSAGTAATEEMLAAVTAHYKLQ